MSRHKAACVGLGWAGPGGTRQPGLEQGSLVEGSSAPPGSTGSPETQRAEMTPGGSQLQRLLGQADPRCAGLKLTAKRSEFPVSVTKKARVYQGQKKALGGSASPEDSGSQGCPHEVLREALVLPQAQCHGV